jgi:hypothetical protein
MARQRFARRPYGEVELDICFGCQAIWFDHYESSQLTPGATIELFHLIDERAARSVRPIAANGRCPLCHKALVFTHDIQRTNRFTYHRCPDWHGRFVTFFQFLREKQFVRSLSGAEIERLKATVAQVRCSSCGASVSVERDAACKHCGAPLSILDADAVRRALHELGEAESQRHKAPDPFTAIDAVITGRQTEQRLRSIEVEAPAVDLLREAIGALARIL